MSGHVVFLQNAWSPVYAGGTWPRRSWLKALENSRSGQRLRILIDDFSVCHNTTPIVGATPDSVVPPDDNHILEIVNWLSPGTVVVTCGKQAEEALVRLWDGPILALPHPAYRVLTNDLYEHARFLLNTHYTVRMAYLQGRGKIECRELRGYHDA